MFLLLEIPLISGSRETVILFVLAIFLFVVSIILLILEKGVKKRIKEISLNRTFFYTKQIKEIKKRSSELDPKQLVMLINSIGKSFFRDYLGLNREATYEELAGEFKKAGDSNKAKICESLSEIVYSKDSIDKDNVLEILDQLEKIITEEGVISEQAKKIKGMSKKNVKQIKILFKEGIESLKKNDMGKAQQIYINITKLYKRIDSKNKVKLQPKLMQLYKKMTNV